MWVPNDLYGLLIVLFSLLILLGLAEVWRYYGGGAEVTRKFVHISGGVVCLFLPFLIQSVWVVLGFAASIFLVFYFAEKNKRFMSIHGVARKSHGTIYYPLAIFLIFFLSKNQPWLYVTPILVLALCDSAASLVGGKYGLHFYNVENEQKSMEGSLIFMLIAYLVIQIPILLMTDIPRADVVMASLLVAILVTGVEAISLEGTDNLFVPISVCLVLARITTKTFDEMLYQNISLIAICLFAWLGVWRFRAFNMGATILLVLFAYGTWSLGSELWALPIFMMSLIYFALWAKYHGHVQFKFTKVRRATKALTVPFVILFSANYTGQFSMMYPAFIAANAVLFSAIIVNFVRYDPKILRMQNILRAFFISTLTWLLVAVPPWIVGAEINTSELYWVWVVVFLLTVVLSYLPVLSDEKLDKLNSKNTLIPSIAAVSMVLVQFYAKV